MFWAIGLASGLAAEPVVLFLKNGDRLTGEVVSRDEKQIVIQSSIAGKITIPLGEVERMTPPSAVTSIAPSAPKPASGPDLVPAATASTTPAPSPTPAAPVAAAKPPPPPPILVVQVATNAPTSDPFIPGWFTGIWTNWHGNLQSGLNLGIGTKDRSTIYGNASASKKWGRTVSTLTYNTTYGEVNGVRNANQMAGTARVDVDLLQKRRAYTYTQGAAGYDEIRKIDLEYLAGGGAGYRIYDKPNRVVATELGFQYQSFNYSTSADQSSVAIRLGENFTASFDKLKITQRIGFTPSVEDLSNYQVNFLMTLSYPLFKPLTLNLNLINLYLSKPATGVQNNDLQIQTTIGITF